MPAGRWWSRADQQPPADIRDVDKLAVMEWIVHPDRRGEGIGAELIRRLLEDRQERYATLASDPRSAARGMYERAGWRQVARTQLSWGPAMDLLVLETHAPSNPEAG
jgi:GNAT superfamily N-acetyltransferase